MNSPLHLRYWLGPTDYLMQDELGEARPTLATVSKQFDALARTNIRPLGNSLPIRSHCIRARSNWLAPPADREMICLLAPVVRGGPQSIAAPGKHWRVRGFGDRRSYV